RPKWIDAHSGEHNQRDIGHVAAAADLAADALEVPGLFQPDAPRLEVVFEQQIADRRRPVGEHPFEETAIVPLELQQSAEEGKTRAKPVKTRWLRQFGRIVLVTRVQEYEAGNVRRKELCKAARVDAPQRVADEDVRRWHAGDAQERQEFLRDLGCAAWKFSLVAPPGSRAVVKHACREPGGLLV